MVYAQQAVGFLSLPGRISCVVEQLGHWLRRTAVKVSPRVKEDIVVGLICALIGFFVGRVTTSIGQHLDEHDALIVAKAMLKDDGLAADLLRGLRASHEDALDELQEELLVVTNGVKASQEAVVEKLNEELAKASPFDDILSAKSQIVVNNAHAGFAFFELKRAIDKLRNVFNDNRVDEADEPTLDEFDDAWNDLIEKLNEYYGT